MVLAYWLYLYFTIHQPKLIFVYPIRYYSHNNDYLEICRCYKAIYEISSVKENPSRWIPVTPYQAICDFIYEHSLSSFLENFLHAGVKENMLVLGSLAAWSNAIKPSELHLGGQESLWASEFQVWLLTACASRSLIIYKYYTILLPQNSKCSLVAKFWVLRLFSFRLLLKQLVTMEVIQWTALWNTYKDEFENEKNILGGSLGDKAAEDLKQRIIEHVCCVFTYTGLRIMLSIYFFLHIFFYLFFFFFFQNIIVVSKYYSRITLKRIAELLCLSIQVSWCLFKFIIKWCLCT